jgi:hypothetical protein
LNVGRACEDKPHAGIVGVTLHKTRPTSILFVSSMILLGRVFCKVTPAMPTWGSSSESLGTARGGLVPTRRRITCRGMAAPNLRNMSELTKYVTSTRENVHCVGRPLDLSYPGLRVIQTKGTEAREGHNLARRSCPRTLPLSSQYGIYKTVKARSWPWLSGKSP